MLLKRSAEKRLYAEMKVFNVKYLRGVNSFSFDNLGVALFDSHRKIYKLPVGHWVCSLYLDYSKQALRNLWH